MAAETANQKSSKPKTIDALDNKIIKLLQKDGRISNTDMAKSLKMSEAAIRARVKRLIDEEIVQIVAVRNPLRLGFHITGDLYIDVEMAKIDRVLEALQRLPELWYIVMTTGETNINAEFVVKSLDDLNDLVYHKMSAIDGIRKVSTSVIMKYVKRNYEFGTGF